MRITKCGSGVSSKIKNLYPNREPYFEKAIFRPLRRGGVGIRELLCQAIAKKGLNNRFKSG